MAKLVFDYPEDFMSNLLESDFNEIAYEALSEAVPTLEKSVKRECAVVIADKSRHELVESIKPWVNFIQFKNGARAWGVSFEGKPSRASKWTRSSESKARTTTNNDIAWWLENGNRNQEGKPFIDRATRNATNKVMNIMQAVYERKVKL